MPRKSMLQETCVSLLGRKLEISIPSAVANQLFEVKP